MSGCNNGATFIGPEPSRIPELSKLYSYTTIQKTKNILRVQQSCVSETGCLQVQLRGLVGLDLVHISHSDWTTFTCMVVANPAGRQQFSQRAAFPSGHHPRTCLFRLGAQACKTLVDGARSIRRRHRARCSERGHISLVCPEHRIGLVPASGRPLVDCPVSPTNWWHA
jgi:hypothetical protein